MSDQFIEAKFVVGNRSWRSRVARDSIIGAWLAGDETVLREVFGDLVEDLNAIDSVQASGGLTTGAADSPDGLPLT